MIDPVTLAIVRAAAPAVAKATVSWARTQLEDDQIEKLERVLCEAMAGAGRGRAASTRERIKSSLRHPITTPRAAIASWFAVRRATKEVAAELLSHDREHVLDVDQGTPATAQSTRDPGEDRGHDASEAAVQAANGSETLRDVLFGELRDALDATATRPWKERLRDFLIGAAAEGMASPVDKVKGDWTKVVAANQEKATSIEIVAWAECAVRRFEVLASEELQGFVAGLDRHDALAAQMALADTFRGIRRTVTVAVVIVVLAIPADAELIHLIT